MVTVIFCLVVAAFICLVYAAVKAWFVPAIWTAALLLCLIELLRALPMGK